MTIDIDGALFLFGIMYPLIILQFFRKLLERYQSWKILLIINVVLALIGAWFTIIDFGNGKINLSFSLIFPLYSTLVFRTMYLRFIKRKQREPIDTTLNFASGLSSDRVFNISYLLLITVVPIFVAAYFAIF